MVNTESRSSQIIGQAIFIDEFLECSKTPFYLIHSIDLKFHSLSPNRTDLLSSTQIQAEWPFINGK